MELTGQILHEIVGTMLLATGSVLMLLGWYIARAERVASGTWLPPWPMPLEWRLALFMLLDGVVYFIFGATVVTGDEPLDVPSLIVVVLLSVMATALFLGWAKENRP